MGNILSYLKWRGDIPFAASEFNIIDNLILSQLAYIDFSDVVPDFESDDDISLLDAYNLIAEDNVYKSLSLLALPVDLLAEAAKSPRFQNIRLSKYIDKYNEEQHLQFAALHFILDDGTTYIAFRGTDTTIIGWREDFMMSFCIIPAQTESLLYLKSTMKPDGVYRIGGHSKGGNLAIYSSMMLDTDIQNQIVGIYNNDGPGLSPELIASEGYAAICGRITRINPEFSVIGNLFEHKNDLAVIVKSSASGLMQHDPMTWEVQGTELIYRTAHTSECIAINEVFDNWIESVDKEEQMVFVDNFFDALAAGGARQMSEVASRGMDGFEAVLYAMIKSEKKAKITVLKLLKEFWNRCKRINFADMIRNSGILKGALLALLGLFFMELPEHALKVTGTTAVFICCVFATRWFVKKFKRADWKIGKVKYYALVYIFVIVALSILFFINNKTIIFSSNFVMGVLFFIYGFYRLRKTMKDRNVKIVFQTLGWIEAILSLAFGLVALVTTNRILGTYVFTVGTFLIVSGLRIIIVNIYKMTAEKNH